MGKSDPYVFSAYKTIIGNNLFKSIGFFGYEKPNNFTNWFESENKDFYDLAINNWEINTFPYVSKKDIKYDLIVCTRVAYFCKNPEKMLREFSRILKPGGKILVDWGIGDHWRFKDYKVGWVKNNEHEWAYNKDNFLWSFAWSESLETHPEVIKFKKNIEKFNYNKSLTETIIDEVPVVLELTKIKYFNKINCLLFSLWEDLPQLYLCLILEK